MTMPKMCPRHIALSAGVLVTSTLQAQHTEEIVVVGTPRDLTTGELAQPVSVLRDEALRRAQGANLGETLAGELGITATHFGAGASRPVIRGLAGARVKTMEDGIDSLDVSTISVDHAVSVDPIVAEQIEIFRGPTTLLYGSGALGGVINTVTRRIPELAPDGGLEGLFEIRADTAAGDRTGVVNLDGGARRYAWHLDAVRRDAGDYDIPEWAELAPEEGEPQPGTLSNSGFETTSMAVGASWLGELGHVGISVSDFRTDYGVPAHHHEEHEEHEDEDHEEDAHDDEDVRIDLRQKRVDLKAAWSGLSGPVESARLRVGFSDYRHVELEGEEPETRFDSKAYEGRLELLHRPWGAWEGAFGIQFGERDFSAIGAEAFVPPVKSSSFGAFALEHRDFGDWNVSLGARLEAQDHEPSADLPGVRGTASSLSFAALRRLPRQHALAVHAAYAQRLPVAEELYADGPHLASRTFEVGDPSLRKETSRHVDIGLRRTEGDVTWSLTAFYTSFSDFIFLRATGLEDEPSGLPIFVHGQGDADISGLEAEVFTPIARTAAGEFDLRLFTDYVRGELATGEKLPRLPPLRYGARVVYHDREERFVAGVEAARHARQDEAAPHEEQTPGYTMLNADFAWTLPSSGTLGLTLLLKGTNLLDEDARRHTSLVKDIAPLPGRNYLIAVRASF